jgi:hypothetical protein
MSDCPYDNAVSYLGFYSYIRPIYFYPNLVMAMLMTHIPNYT